MARTSPILSMLERIRMYLLRRFSHHRTLSDNWQSDIGPRVTMLLEAVKDESSTFIAHFLGGGKYQVQGLYGEMHSVDLQRRSCSCRKWDLSGIPCGHAICCIWRRQQSPIEYVSAWQKKEMHVKTYTHQIFPIRPQKTMAKQFKPTSSIANGESYAKKA